MISRINKSFHNLSSAKKSALVFMLGSYIQYAISFLVTPIFSRLLTTGEFGLVTTYNSWQEILGPIAGLSLYAGFFNVGMVDYEKERDRFTSSMLGLSLVSTMVTMLLFFGINFLAPSLTGLPFSLIILLGIHFLTFSPTRFWMARERFEYKYKKLFLVTMAIALLSPTGGLLCVMLTNGNRGTARLFGTNAIHIIIGIVFIVVLLLRSSKLFDRGQWKLALSFSIPLIPHYLAMHVLSASDRVMINSMAGSDSAGVYGMAYTAALVVTAAWTAINGSLTPYALNKIKERDFRPLAHAGMSCVMGFSVICLLVCIVAPEAILFLGGEKYRESIELLPPLLAAVVFMEMYNLFSLVEFYHKKTKMVMAATLTAALINLALNFICIQLFGYKAAAYTTLVCYILYCAFHYLNMCRIEKEKIYDLKSLIVFSAVYVTCCFACLLIYDHPFIRYGLLIGGLFLAVVKRRIIFTVIGAFLKR